MRKVRTFYPLYGVLALLSTSAAGAAEPATAHLSLDQRQTELCVTGGSLATAVEQRLKRPVFVERAKSDLHVEIMLAESADRVDVEISLSTQAGQSLGKRSLTSPKGDCSRLIDSLSLVLALMVDLNREEVRSRTSEATEDAREPTQLDTETAERHEVEPSKTQATGAVASTHADPASRWILGLGGFSLLGPFPDLAFGMRGSAAWHGRRWSEELGVAAVFPVTTTDGANGRAEFSQVLADGSLCAAPLVGHTVVVRVCGGLELGVTRAEGLGYLRARTAHLPVLSPSVRTDSTWWPTPRIGLRLGLGAKAAVYRDRFFAVREDGSEHELFRPAFGALFLQADVCVKL